MKSLTRVMLIAALTVLPMMAAAPSQAAKKMEVAVQDDGIFLYQEHYNREVAYQQLRALGATHLRMNILWWQPIPEAQRNSRTKPRNITYNWDVWDDAIARARAYGIKVQLDLAGDPPRFACGNKKVPYECDGYKPNLTLWSQFVRAAVAHFKGRVSRFSMWNEPNWYTWISPHKRSPILYRNLYKAGYKAAKRANPKAEVVMGELAPHFQRGISMPPLQFIREMVCVNKRLQRTRNANKQCGRKPLKLDAFSTHPYDFEHKPSKKRSNKDELTMANLGALPKLLDKLRKKGLLKPSKKKFPIYLTEHGYMVTGNPDVRRERRIPESRRAKWIVQSWDIAQETPRIKQNLHYIFVSPPLGSPSSFFDMGLIASNGVPR
ncbi:MAG: GH39 family glycosyl hydrolase, partial [Thermoleophilaceae bacterium]